MSAMTDDGPPVAVGGDVDPPGPGRVSGRQLRELLADEGWPDELIDRSQQGGVLLTGQGGFLPELVKAVLERGLATALTAHLGYEVGDPAGRGSGNSRNGKPPIGRTVDGRVVVLSASTTPTDVGGLGVVWPHLAQLDIGRVRGLGGGERHGPTAAGSAPQLAGDRAVSSDRCNTRVIIRELRWWMVVRVWRRRRRSVSGSRG